MAGTACGSLAQGSVVPSDAAAFTAGAAPGHYIKHIVIVVQENRSLNMLFAGYPGATTSMHAQDSTGKTVSVGPIRFTDPRGDIGHGFSTGVGNWDNGKMDAFDKNFISLTSGPAGDYPYSYLDRKDSKTYWSIAQQYVLADQMFPEEWGSSFTAHQDLIAATTELTARTAVADNPTAQPWGCGAPAGTRTNLAEMVAGSSGPGRVVYGGGPFPCYSHVTMANVLDEKHVSWKYYAPAVGDPGSQLWSAFSAIRAVYHGSDWKNVVSPPQTILTDAAKGTLPAVSWVIPDYLNSDHPGARSDKGPAWVASVVNAIGKSPDWNSTAIFIVWDDWGGWYDPVAPPQKDYLGLGIRVPCLIVSPYARHGFVDHDQYEFASILKTVEQTFGVPSMGTDDTRATAMFDAFNFTQRPRRFTPVEQRYPESFFLMQRPSLLPPDND